MSCLVLVFAFFTTLATLCDCLASQKTCEPKRGFNDRPVGWWCDDAVNMTCYARNYYYNSGTNRCEMFEHKGCGGNRNNFPSIEDCMNHCLRSSTKTYPINPARLGQVLAKWLEQLPDCNVTFNPATESGGITRFFLNSTSHRCEPIRVRNGDKYFPAMRYCVEKCNPHELSPK
ncbi:anticoagulant protein rhipilin-2-like [Haemaphysalis longicornis]